MEEEQGIYRGEVMEMMGALADIRVAVDRILSYTEGDDDEGKEAEEEELLLKPEERQGQEERLQSLLRMYERAKIELETGKRPPPDAATQS